MLSKFKYFIEFELVKIIAEKSLIFISCEIHGSSDIVVSATGTWKILN